MTKICDCCGKEFDEKRCIRCFSDGDLINYDFLTKCLCAECAIEAIDDEDDGIYYEVCDNCGSRFDPFAAELELQRRTGDYGVEIDMYGKYLCHNCALDEYRTRND